MRRRPDRFGAKAHSFQQRRRADAKGVGELLDHDNSWISCAALQVADVGSVNAGFMGIGLLAPALRLSQATQVHPKALSNIHGADEAPMSLIVLQTMSDNSLDWLAQ